MNLFNINPLPVVKILSLSKSKAFANKDFIVAQILQIVYDMVKYFKCIGLGKSFNNFIYFL